MASPTPAPSKRIVLCCDGTWMDADGSYQIPSNVTRLARAIRPVCPKTKLPQLIFYQNGVGTGSPSLYTKYVGGATGEGLAENIREAYSFACLNYSDGDEIFVVGFSRGAFTARSISSLIEAVGLLTSKGLENFLPIFEDWEFQSKHDYVSRWPHLPFPGHKPPVTDTNYQEKLLRMGLTRPKIKIKCVAVWDTVGGLGIPMVGLLPQPPSKDFSFVDTRVAANIEHAFHAMALDEHRRAYTPTVWDWPHVPCELKVLKQVWFPGVHSDVGGSYPDTALANLTLTWMVSMLDPLLAINHDYIKALVLPDPTPLPNPIAGGMLPHTDTNKKPTNRPWGLGMIHNSMTGFFKLGGSRVRTPLEYREQSLAAQHGTFLFILDALAHRVSRWLGHPEHLQPRLARTEESIHSSVRIRMGQAGLGPDDRGPYDSPALEGWAFAGADTNPDTPIALAAPGLVGTKTGVVWSKRVDAEEFRDGEIRKARDGSLDHLLEMPEEPLGEFEREILQLWPKSEQISHNFGSIVPPQHHHARTVTRSQKPTGMMASGATAANGARRSDAKNGSLHVETTG